MLRTVASLVFFAVLGACRPAFINGVPNENSPFFEVPVDSRFLLRQPVDVPAGADSVYFQDGQNLPWFDVNIYDAWCVLKLDTKRGVVQTIEPDEFVVDKVSAESFFHLAVAPARPIARPAAMDLETDDSEAYEVKAWVMRLRSSRQPDVARMVCADWGSPAGGSYLTVHKIRHTLGELFELELAVHAR